MNNLLVLMVTMLHQLGVFTEKEAKNLAEELQSATLPDSFASSNEQMKELFNKLEIPRKVFPSMAKAADKKEPSTKK